MTFSDVHNSLVDKEEAAALTTSSMFSSATSTTTEYFSAVSSDDEDDFFDIQTDTEREDEGEDIKQAPVIKPLNNLSVKINIDYFSFNIQLTISNNLYFLV